jgi:Uma2 family endonuclease
MASVTTRASSAAGDLGPVVCAPPNVKSLAEFREWAKSDDFPERGRISYIAGDLVIDMSPEGLQTHIRVKTELGSVLHRWCRRLRLGAFYPDGTLVTNTAADLSTEPDGTVVRHRSIRSGRVRLIPHQTLVGEFIEIEGTPDLVIEVVSQSSVVKDTVKLRRDYHVAGIPEYWLIDARGEQVRFQILLYRKARYIEQALPGGWQRSRVFGRSFRLRRRRDELGLWEYFLRDKVD